MSKHQSQTAPQDQAQEPKQGKTEINASQSSVASQPLRIDANDPMIRSQTIRLAKVVSAKFARRD